MSATGNAAMPPNAVPLNLLLDIDGTLALTDRLYVLAFQDLMRPFGYTEVDDAWFSKHVAGKVDAEVFRALLPAGATTEMLEATSRRKDALFVEKVEQVGATIVPGLSGVLEMARRCGWRCIAVTNAQRGGGQAVLDLLRRELGDDLAGPQLTYGRSPPCTHGHSLQPTVLHTSVVAALSPVVCSRHRGPGRGLRVRPGQAAPGALPGGHAATGRGARGLHRLRGQSRRGHGRRHGQGRPPPPAPCISLGAPSCDLRSDIWAAATP